MTVGFYMWLTHGPRILAVKGIGIVQSFLLVN